jgi:ferric-dicitrate binding protein FerR (iron transport regulator)
MSATLREAEKWCSCIHSHECTPDQRAEFLEWLYEDPRHGEAYAVVERMHGRSRLDFSLQRGLKYEYG